VTDEVDAIDQIVVPPEPVRVDLATFPKEMRELYLGVKAALSALPIHFDFDNPISGINATDLFNLSSLMGAAIEIQVVETLNALRGTWDPQMRWSEYRFVRSAQAFPDVRLVKHADDGISVLLGIELKGWFLLSKEGEPSLRYKVSPEACNPWDMVCVVPWYLSSVVAGTPQVAAPWVDQARFAAEWRDYWWEFLRGNPNKEPQKLRGVKPAASPVVYPSKADLVSQTPISDGAGNFGRLPRCKPLMDSFLESALSMDLLGIEAASWQAFFKAHKEKPDPKDLAKLLASFDLRRKHGSEESAERLRELLRELADDFDFGEN
jgi:hypothetical protein